jgi:hypothetical protein
MQKSAKQNQKFDEQVYITQKEASLHGGGEGV